VQESRLHDVSPEFVPRWFAGSKRNQVLKTSCCQGIFLSFSFVRHRYQVSCERRARDFFRDLPAPHGEAIAFPGPNKGSGENLGKVILGCGLEHNGPCSKIKI
jgi:hypothetical protein